MVWSSSEAPADVLEAVLLTSQFKRRASQRAESRRRRLAEPAQRLARPRFVVGALGAGLGAVRRVGAGPADDAEGCGGGWGRLLLPAARDFPLLWSNRVF